MISHNKKSHKENMTIFSINDVILFVQIIQMIINHP